MIKWFIAVILTISVSHANVGVLLCEAGPHTSSRIFFTAVATIYNIFPIKIGNVPMVSFAGVEDFTAVDTSPVCVCAVPLPRVGIKVSLWEPIAIIEPVKIPWCTPTLPTPGGLKVPFNMLAIGGDNAGKGQQGDKGLRSLQAHYYRFLPWALLELFLDFVCLETRAPWDIAYMTEVDPLWNNDKLASLLGPEVALVANPIAQYACSVDALTSAAGFPIDFLWWCMGSWGSLYPMAGNISLDAVQTSAGLTARMIFKLHRELILWGSVGEAGLCGKYPMPIMRKSQYSIFPIYPIPHPFRFPIGRSGSFLWGFGKDVPVVNRHNWAYMIYRKRDCCAF